MGQMDKDFTVYIGLGSNKDNPAAQLELAIHTLRNIPGIQLDQCSGFYRSAPVGNIEQADFINAVCELETTLTPDSLLANLLDIERRHGRERTGAVNEPRTLDLDLLLYGSEILNQGNLIVPHPRLHERAFVLYPLYEIAPKLEIPGLGSIARLRDTCVDQKIARLEPDQVE